jgi:pimeloyl-ACP methyl ester carboxylesterase
MSNPYELSVRRNDWGTGVVPVEPKFPGGSNPQTGGHTRLTFFVHGYNNILATAERTWRRSTFPMLIDHGVSDRRLGEIVLFYWPGDVAKSSLVSAPFYPMLIEAALRAADELATYLATLGKNSPRIRLKFVAHSLGCRVVLEALARLAKSAHRVDVEDILLMAAAVSEGLCTPGTNTMFGGRLARCSEQALHSSKDRVLHMAFIAGEILARDLPVAGWAAVGRTGGPSGRWSPTNVDTKLGHSDYWKDSSSVGRIAELLGLPGRIKSWPVRSREPRSRPDPASRRPPCWTAAALRQRGSRFR